MCCKGGGGGRGVSAVAAGAAKAAPIISSSVSKFGFEAMQHGLFGSNGPNISPADDPRTFHLFMRPHQCRIPSDAPGGGGGGAEGIHPLLRQGSCDLSNQPLLLTDVSGALASFKIAWSEYCQGRA